jgi:hypothetical protein
MARIVRRVVQEFVVREADPPQQESPESEGDDAC